MGMLAVRRALGGVTAARRSRRARRITLVLEPPLQPTLSRDGGHLCWLALDGPGARPDGLVQAELTPAVPPPAMRRGEEARFFVRFFGGSGMAGRVEWETSDCAVLAWTGDPEGDVHAAVLKAVGTGEATVTVRTCLALSGFGSGTVITRVRVVS